MSVRQATGLVHVIRYDPAQYCFREWACGVLGVSCLQLLHERDDIVQMTWHDGMVKCRAELTASFDDCKTTLAALFQREIAPITGVRGGAHQSPPMFRIHFHESPPSSTWHRDGDYGMPAGRLNLWLPLTKVWGNNSLWIRDPDARPIELEYGEAVIFDSATLVHGSMHNNTGYTRVSLDSRFDPPDDSWAEKLGKGLTCDRAMTRFSD